MNVVITRDPLTRASTPQQIRIEGQNLGSKDPLLARKCGTNDRNRRNLAVRSRSGEGQKS